MEYMNIGGVLGSAISKFVNKSLEKSVGFRPNLDIENLHLVSDDNGVLKLELSAKMSEKDFNKLIEEASK